MKAPRLSTALPVLLFVVVLFGGCVASVPLGTWLWWAVPPVELYYSEAYFSSTMAHGNPKVTARVQWLYKTAPDRLNQLVEENDVVADSPANQSDFSIPMHLSSTARSAGWRGLIQGPREEVNAAELERYLRTEFYGNRSFWQLFERPLVWLISIVLVILAAREWLVERSRRESAKRLARWRESLLDNRQDRWGKRTGVQWLKSLQDRVISRARNLIRRRAYLAVNVLRKTGAKHSSFEVRRDGGSAPANLSNPACFAHASSTLIPNTEACLERETKATESALVQQTGSSANRGQNPSSSSHPKRPAKGHLIFPGTSRQSAGDEKAEGWDESQWID